MLKTQLLTDTAKAPTVANPGEDVAYDLYSDEAVMIPPDSIYGVRTGIAIQFTAPARGAHLECRSGMAKKCNASVEAGVIDAGYRGEIIVILRNNDKIASMSIVKGEKFAQMRPIPVVKDKVKVVPTLSESKRGAGGFGSTGKF